MTQLEQELAQLVTRLLDGGLSESETERLAALLNGYAEARELYRNQIEAHTLLEWAFAPPEFIEPPLAEQATYKVVARDVGQGKWLAWLAATAALVLLSLGVYLAFQEAGRHDPASAPVAQIVETRECRWEVEPKPDAGLRTGQTLNLIEGVAAVQFKKGERVILEAPCQVVIRGDTEMTLARGKVTASSPAGTSGFTIAFPMGRLVDRGAEFGMQVLADDSVEVHVFTGKIEAHPTTDAPMIELQANEALRMDEHGPTRLAAAPNRFPNAKADRLVSVRLNRWYALGPLGHPRLKERPADWKIPPVGAKEIRDYNRLFSMFASSFRNGLYPMDPDAKEGVIDLDAVFKGGLTQDVAGIEHEVKWVKRDLERDPVAYPPIERMEKGVGLAYFSTWVHVPKDTSAEIAFHGYGAEPNGSTRLGVLVACFVRGKQLRNYRIQQVNPMVMHPVDHQTVEFKQGWNHLMCRHASSWEGIRNDVRLLLSREIAEGIEVAAEPPKEVGRRFRPNGRPAPN